MRVSAYAYVHVSVWCMCLCIYIHMYGVGRVFLILIHSLADKNAFLELEEAEATLFQ